MLPSAGQQTSKSSTAANRSRVRIMCGGRIQAHTTSTNADNSLLNDKLQSEEIQWFQISSSEKKEPTMVPVGKLVSDFDSCLFGHLYPCNYIKKGSFGNFMNTIVDICTAYHSL